MKKRIFTGLGLLIVLASASQDKKNYHELSFGVQNLQNKTVFSIYPNISDCPMGAHYYSNIKEQSLNLPSISFLRYHLTQIKNLSFISGIGFNQKGFIETGSRVPMDKPSSIENHYSVKHIIRYLNLQLGFNYIFLRYGDLRFSISQIINSEKNMNRNPIFYNPWDNNNDTYKRIAFSWVTFLNIDALIDKNSGLVIKPFFQTALTNYNKARTDFDGNVLQNNYRPFGYGVSIGLTF